MLKKIIIIGAGPIGCYLAQLLKLYGFSPLLIEEHEEVGRPVHCTGLVGKSVFSEQGRIKLPQAAVLNVINGAIIRYKGQSFTVKRNNVAYVIDRERFDKGLSTGLNILFSHRFLGLERFKSKGFIIDTDKGEYFADLVIGADGANSFVRKILNPISSNINSYKGLQVRMLTKVKQIDLVSVYIKKNTFFWVVPEGANVVKVGTISDRPFQDMQEFLKEVKIKGDVLEKFGGMVSVGVCRNTAKDNIALVGDAACQMKPLTFGGIYFGLKSANMLATCIKENRLEDYDSTWKREFSFEIKIGVKIKNAYSRMDDKDIGMFFKLFKENRNLLERYGDFENHSRFIMEVIKKPVLYPRLGKLLRFIFETIL